MGKNNTASTQSLKLLQAVHIIGLDERQSLIPPVIQRQKQLIEADPKRKSKALSNKRHTVSEGKITLSKFHTYDHSDKS